MTYRINAEKTACVALEVEYQPMTSCPLGVRVLGLSRGLVARVDRVTSLRNTDLIGWAPLPRVPQWMKESSEA